MNLHGPQDDRDRHWSGRWDTQRDDLQRKEAEVMNAFFAVMVISNLFI